MAFAQLPSVSVRTPDLWPSISSALSGPWREARLLRRSDRFRAHSGVDNRRNFTSRTEEASNYFSRARSERQKKLGFSQASNHVTLPECLHSISPSAISGTGPSLRSFHTSTRQYSIFDRINAPSTNVQFNSNQEPGTRWIGSRGGSSPSAYLPSRSSSLASGSGSSFSVRDVLFGNPSHGIRLAKLSRRAYATTSTSQSNLAHAERTANNNPTSVTAQATFYSALLRADLPKLVIERYQTGRYATNDATDAAYLKALQINGSVVQGTNTAVGTGVPENPSGLTPEKLQYIGQAVAAHARNGQAGSVTAKNNGSGAKDSPLYVIVEESFRASFFRWVKFIVYAGLSLYAVLVCVSLFFDTFGSLRSRVKQNNEVQPQEQTVRFSDVLGCEEAKDELQELVEFLINPDRFSGLGGKLPKGVLLVGPPGTGKTMLARAVAGEAGCPFFYMSGSEFDEMFVGVGAKRVRDLFAQARAKSPSIIFIDELDAVGGKRNERDPAYAKQTLNQLLTELDGFSPSTGVILIAATNYPQSLDKALTRPGRFDRRVEVGLPDVRGRAAILNHYVKKIAAAADVDTSVLARGTSGFSGAELENLVNQAAVRASRKKQKKVHPLDFEWAKDKITMGAERKSKFIREEDKIMTAYHEAGHALVNLHTPGSLQLHKMTILPRGPALGVTYSIPDMDAVSMQYRQFLASIDVAMGGRSAEELVYGPERVTSGCSSDLQNATSTAYALVTQYGFSEKMGSLEFASYYEKLSSQTKQEIEKEVRSIVEAARSRADNIVKTKRQELELLKDALIQYETLSREEIMQAIKGEKIQRIEPEVEQDSGDGKKDEPEHNRGGSPPPKPKETSSKGGVGIKLPEVLIPGTRRDGEGG